MINLVPLQHYNPMNDTGEVGQENAALYEY
jgi:hypothetical protein